METLTIKELAPYIPYNLFVIDEFGMKCRVVLDFEYSIDDRQIRPSYLLKRGYKPLLRPLSDFPLKPYHGYPNMEMFYEDVKNETVCVKIWNELLKGHYDVSNLIRRGLAIDLNAIKETVK